MTILSVGGQIYTDYVDLHRGDHHHEAEDLVDNGKLNITDAEFDTLTITSGAQFKLDSALAYTPADSNGQQIPDAEYRIGRQENIGDTTQGLLDGLNFKHTLDSEEQKINVQLHPSAPTIDIEGSKDANVDWLRITDGESNQVVFAVHDDGTVQTPGWASGDLPDGYHSSIATGSNSVYVGGVKLSEANGGLKISHLKAPPYIPLRLTQAPYSFTTGNINANSERTVNEWMVLARSTLSASESKALRIRDVFTTANTAVDFVEGGSFGESKFTTQKLEVTKITGNAGGEGEIHSCRHVGCFRWQRVARGETTFDGHEQQSPTASPEDNYPEVPA